MSDEARAEGRQLERFRQYLCLLARERLSAALRDRVDLSGVVQQTLLEAHQAMAQLRRLSAAQQAAWLRRALARNLTDEVRKLRTAARDVARECPLDGTSSSEGGLAAEGLSPAEQAIHNEQLLRLAEALARLPDDQRTAVELHHLHGLPLAAVAGALGRRKGAVATLLFRGLTRLRKLLRAAERE